MSAENLSTKENLVTNETKPDEESNSALSWVIFIVAVVGGTIGVPLAVSLLF